MTIPTPVTQTTIASSWGQSVADALNYDGLRLFNGTGGVYIEEYFQSINAFDFTIVGAGSFSVAAGELDVSTSADIDDEEEIIRNMLICNQVDNLSWNKSRRFKTAIQYSSVANIVVYCGLGSHADSRFTGFKIVNNNIFGCAINAAGEELTGAIGTAQAGVVLTPQVLEVYYDATLGKSHYYIDGVLKASITKTIDSTPTCLFNLYIKTTVAAVKSVYTHMYKFYQYP